MMKRYAVLAVLLLICCNELPIGEEEYNIRGNFDAQELELTLNNTLTESDPYAYLGKSPNLIVGQNNDYESRILLKFDFADTSYQGLDEIKLIMRTNLNFNNDTIRVSIHLLVHEFDEEQANWFQRMSGEHWESEGGDFDDDSLRFAELKGDSLLITFNYIELDEIISADGMIIIPVDSGFSHFYSKEGGYAPKFLLIKNDVTTSIQLSDDCHIVTGPEPFYTESWIGSGIPYRNYVKFEYDSILDDKKAVYAELTFRPEHHFLMRDSIEIGVKQLLEPLDDFNTETGPFIALERFAADDTVFNIDIVRHIQHIIEHPDSNFGFFIVMSPENYEIASYKITHGSHTLKVGYILPPQARY